MSATPEAASRPIVIIPVNDDAVQDDSARSVLSSEPVEVRYGSVGSLNSDFSPGPSSVISSVSSLAGDVLEESLEIVQEETLDIEALNEWLVCICVVCFDIELGQSLEYAIPEVELGKQLWSDICFCSFPDSNVTVGNLVYSFRVVGETALYGYVYFRQAKDATVTRGYLQKSVVILTRQPLPGLFLAAVKQLGALYFKHGQPLLEAACHDISQWSPQSTGLVDLPILGKVLHVELPSRPFAKEMSFHREHSPHPIPRQAIEQQLLASEQHINLFSRFHELLPYLWLLWELTLLGEPVLIVAEQPDVCSDAVLSLTSLIAPIRYRGDYRPFFTIHDSSFPRFSSEVPADGVILGVTNPFFVKALEQWPHVVTIGRGVATSSRGKFKTQRRRHKNSFSPRADTERAGMLTAYQPTLKPDKAILQNILQDKQPTLDTAVEHNNQLRRHFSDLTGAFLNPLERYFTSLMPLAREISPFEPLPDVHEFVPADFLAVVEATPPAWTKALKKQAWVNLYTNFVGSLNFRGWLEEKELEALGSISLTFLRQVCEVDYPSWSLGRPVDDLVKFWTAVMRTMESVVNTSEYVKLYNSVLGMFEQALSACSEGEDRECLQRVLHEN